jgi:hypothetical protein
LPSVVKKGVTPIYRSNKPPRSGRPHSTVVTATAVLDAIVILIALCDLLLLVPLLALGPPPATAAWLHLKISSSGRGAFAGTRWKLLS